MSTPCIRAKFKVDKVTKYAYGAEEVELSAVYGENNENASFSKATPVGKHSMTISNEAAHGFFVAGREYYLDFTAAN